MVLVGSGGRRQWLRAAALSPLLSPVIRRNFFPPLLWPSRRTNFAIEIMVLRVIFLFRENSGETGEETAEDAAGEHGEQAKTAVG
jgi:hypothetical protein